MDSILHLGHSFRSAFLYRCSCMMFKRKAGRGHTCLVHSVFCLVAHLGGKVSSLMLPVGLLQSLLDWGSSLYS